jgi:predicted ATPase
MLIKKIHLQNVLSYGANSMPLELQPLNVIIGPNGSGKSNLIECLAVLQATPKNLAAAIGSVSDFLWKGAVQPEGTIEIWLAPLKGVMPIRHQLVLSERGGRLELIDESIENAEKRKPDHSDVYFFYRYKRGWPVLTTFDPKKKTLDESKPPARSLKREDLMPDQSILSQRKDPDLYPELAYVEGNYSTMKIYREWHLGRGTMPRKAQKTDLPRNFLQEDAGNLALVLSNMNTRFPGVQQRILELLVRLDENIIGLSVDIVGSNEIQVFLSYQGLKQPIPATRLSDGTLRYLCLLAILCHPQPPAVVCIEEPEIGLHPDILPTIGELLKEASKHCQLFVTTHSEILIDSLSDTPESVLICEKKNGETTLRRLEAAPLAEWLDKYSLGQLWTMGELGGNRW